MIQKHLQTIAIAAVVLMGTQGARGQGTAINTSGTAAAASAMLDVQSTNQGVLVPRIATPATAITSPVTGLMVYNTTTNQFNYYNGTAWTVIGAPTGTAGGDLTGSYPNPTISSTAGSDLVTAINASAGGLSGTKLATGSVSVNALSASGTASNTTFLRGDNSWAAAGGGSSLSTGTAAGQVYLTGAGGTVPATPVSVSGDATLSATGALTLAGSGAAAGTYGSSTTVPQFNVDAKGRITAIINQTITVGAAFGAIATGTTVSNNASSPTVIPTGTSIYYFNLPTTGTGFMTLPCANTVAAGTMIYVYPTTTSRYNSSIKFGVGPCNGNTIYANGGSAQFGTSPVTNFIAGRWQYETFISDGNTFWYLVADY